MGADRDFSGLFMTFCRATKQPAYHTVRLYVSAHYCAMVKGHQQLFLEVIFPSWFSGSANAGVFVFLFYGPGETGCDVGSQKSEAADSFHSFHLHHLLP